MTANESSHWTRDQRLAVNVSVMLEEWADGVAPGIGPMGNPLPAHTLDLQARSWAAYGPNVGAWRLMDILASRQCHAVFYVSGQIAERNPQLLAAIAAAGHEVAAHGWTQDVIPASQTPERETADLERCIAALGSATGTPPRGWVSPRCTPSVRTTELLAARGFLWHADYFDADLPRQIPTQAGPIVAMPFTMEINDLPMAIRYGNEPEAFTRTLERIVGNWSMLGKAACLDVTVHAHLFGRPAGAIEFAKSLDVVRNHGDVAWLTHHAELARLTSA